MTEHQARKILGLPTHANRKQGNNRYRYLLKKNYPDKGGTTEQCQAIIAAWQILKNLLPSGLPVVTLLRVDTDSSEKLFFRWAQRYVEPDGSFSVGAMHTYTRIKSNVYIWSQPNQEFYPRFREEDKTLHDGKNCKVIIFPEDMKGCDWAEWVVPWE